MKSLNIFLFLLSVSYCEKRYGLYVDYNMQDISYDNTTKDQVITDDRLNVNLTFEEFKSMFVEFMSKYPKVYTIAVENNATSLGVYQDLKTCNGCDAYDLISSYSDALTEQGLEKLLTRILTVKTEDGNLQTQSIMQYIMQAITVVLVCIIIIIKVFKWNGLSINTNRSRNRETFRVDNNDNQQLYNIRGPQTPRGQVNDQEL